jgi:ribosomal protein S18 acetylase RimI-like enzyme
MSIVAAGKFRWRDILTTACDMLSARHNPRHNYERCAERRFANWQTHRRRRVRNFPEANVAVRLARGAALSHRRASFAISLAERASLREASAMDELALTIRAARPKDAAEVARIYIESWHDTYPGVLSSALLCAMTLKGQTARWLSAIRAQKRETVLVAEDPKLGIVAMSSMGASRDRSFGYDGEVYTLYVDPNHFGRGAGRTLLNGAFAVLRARGFGSCVIWAHAHNNARFFYETMGGRAVAERTARMMGDVVPEVAFGWKTLALAERSHAK